MSYFVTVYLKHTFLLILLVHGTPPLITYIPSPARRWQLRKGKVGLPQWHQMCQK